jgi:hypothetical protein
MAVGAGYAPAGLGLSIVVRTLLTLVGRWELSHYGATRGTAITIDFEPDHGKTEIKLEQLLEEYMISRNAIQESNEVEGRVRWVIQFRLTERHRRELLLGLVDIPEVLSIERQ